MAKLGIGTYRITDTNQAHIDTLITAIREGIDFFDTAVDFTDGAAHRALAKVLPLADDDVTVVSKFGYIQGRVLEALVNDKELFNVVSEEMIQLEKNRFYSIAPTFLKHQLSMTLKELEQESINFFLLNNPEHLLLHFQKEFAKEEALDMFFDKLFDSFVAFEEEVASGKIKKGYGISSASFSAKEDEAIYFPYEKLIEIAHEAAMKVGNKKHHFLMIELPINIAQKQGLFCSFWAKEQGLSVVATQPLSVVYNAKPYRLAQKEENRDYYIYLNELLDFCDNELLEPIFNLINDLDERKHQFNDILSYEQFVLAEVLPYIKKTLQKVDPDTQEKLLFMLEMFLDVHKEMVDFECGEKTKKELSLLFQGCDKTIQECAIEYLLKQESIDYVVVGARRVKYLYEFLSLAEKIY